MSEQQQASERVAIVTGDSRGIGRQTVERLGGKGISVAVNYAANQAEAAAAVTSVVSRGGKAIAVCADVADENAVAALFDQVEQTFGGRVAEVFAKALQDIARMTFPAWWMAARTPSSSSSGLSLRRTRRSVFEMRRLAPRTER